MAMGEPTRIRNPEGTRRAVLDAAERLFAERGFAGTSMRDIADASGVSQPLIQHHFGRKEELYAAALGRALECFTARFPEVTRVTDQPLDLRAEVSHLFAFAQDHSLTLRMVQWARLEGRHDLVAGVACPRGAMVGRIASAQRLGLIRGDIDPATLAVAIEGLVFFWVENREFNAKLFPELPDDDAYLSRIVAIIERGFASGAASRAKPD